MDGNWDRDTVEIRDGHKNRNRDGHMDENKNGNRK